MQHDTKSGCKYIAVRNWAKFQGRLRSGKTRRNAILDASAKDSDPDYSKLTFYQRYMLDGLRRLTALHGQNPYNDHAYVARALCAMPADRPHVAHAMDTLITRGFLVLTNERDPFSPTLFRAARSEVEVEKKRSEEEEKPESVNESAAKPQAQQETPNPPASDVPEKDVERLCEVLSSYSGLNVTDEWRKYARLILNRGKLPALESLLEWMFEEDDFWGSCTHTMMNFYDHLEKGNLFKKYNAQKALKNKRAAKAKNAAEPDKPEYKKQGAKFI